ncbi:MAG: glycoside hydrolase family 10 [Paenibacillaceae bacterium]|jgi:GH35 family endo-1,4-beta-xylanase|nr:glycoside hydrolase family 10 [Paenibacillaceae bacterium]
MPRKDVVMKYFNEQKDYMTARVNGGIEEHRKGSVVVEIIDQNGKPVENGILEVKQKNHEFKYGANIFLLDELETQEKNDLYRRKFPEAFNLATIPFYWSDLEPEQGKPRYEKDSVKIYRRPATDLCVDYCLENGIEPKAHCLNYDNFLPTWLEDATVSEHKKALEKRFLELAECYADKIPSWEVTNETFNSRWRKQSKFYFEDDFVEWSFRMADRYFPNNKLIINDYDVWQPQIITNRLAYYMQIERLIANGVHHLDSIGFQFHCFFPRQDEESRARLNFNPKQIYDLLDLYAKTSKRLQITEMTLSAYSNDEEDEEVQAELLKNLYSIYFSHPAMEAIIYWNLIDGYTAFAPQGDMTVGENIYYGGLLRYDMSEKPAYKMIKYLFNELWRTNTSAVVNNGKAAFRGFYGDYDLIIHADEKAIPASISTSRDKHNQFKIII